MEIAELIRLLRSGASDHTIARVLHHTRRTIARYRRWAETQGLLTGDPPPLDALHQQLQQTLPSPLPPQQTSSVVRYADEILALRGKGLEAAAIRARLEERHQTPISYQAVWRFLRHQQPASPETFVRVEVPPGSEAQVDFGYAGLTIDPATNALRKTWVFVLVLSHSRHRYAELVFDQRVETWLLCHAHAFACFGGVPARIVPDNLKAAIVTASFTEPVAQRAYRECAQHYGFLIDPTPPRSPHLKGKVEQGGVHYVKRNFLARREPAAIDGLNQALRTWTAEIAGQRVHGTTRQRPLVRFQEAEQAALLPLPATPYDPAVWQRATVYRDGYVTFERAYYSAPYRLVGQPLWVRGGARTVQLSTEEHQLVATHTRAQAPGERQTDPAHLPPEKLPGLLLTREGCRTQAEAIGPATLALVQRLLAHRPEDRLRSAGRVLGLAARHTPARLEAACARADHFGEADYATVKRILQQGLDQAPLPVAAAPPPSAEEGGGYTFVRQASDFVASLFAAAAGVR
jgi:transposase